MSETLEGVPFAISPALVHNNAPINYRTAEGSKIFKGAISPLPTCKSSWMNSETGPSYMIDMLFYCLKSKAWEIYAICWIHMEKFHFRR
jgi:hypothetical protein